MTDAHAKPPPGSIEQLLERPYKPPELCICEEVSARMSQRFKRQCRCGRPRFIGSTDFYVDKSSVND